jgi:signal transduction histidine kinase
MIQTEVARAAGIVRRLLDFARQREPSFGPVDLCQAVRDAVSFVERQASLDNHQILVESASERFEVLGDAQMLQQVFLNLLTNARQAMEEGETRHLTVRTALAAGGNRPVVIAIADTGKGFSAEEAGRLFTPFYSTKKDGHGTGLGLTISQRIVKDHGGVIAAEGSPGQGACFTIRLPLPKPEEIREALGTHG